MSTITVHNELMWVHAEENALITRSIEITHLYYLKFLWPWQDSVRRVLGSWKCLASSWNWATWKKASYKTHQMVFFFLNAILFLKCTLKTIKKFGFICSVYFNQSLQNVLGVLEQVETILRVVGATCLKVERRDTSEKGERVWPLWSKIIMWEVRCVSFFFWTA